MGDRLGIPGAVGFCRPLLLLPSSQGAPRRPGPCSLAVSGILGTRRSPGCAQKAGAPLHRPPSPAPLQPALGRFLSPLRALPFLGSAGRSPEGGCSVSRRSVAWWSRRCLRVVLGRGRSNAARRCPRDHPGHQ
uniref:Uncharacterized protein n=1 Tax=Rousettus aegyptiacus TaxID=9407 RepID=A0A7J8B983_ROUAE|nr:hypothetical protein HJG63_009959 [Rousettus aegyptiacus]